MAILMNIYNDSGIKLSSEEIKKAAITQSKFLSFLHRKTQEIDHKETNSINIKK